MLTIENNNSSVEISEISIGCPPESKEEQEPGRPDLKKNGLGLKGLKLDIGSIHKE